VFVNPIVDHRDHRKFDHHHRVLARAARTITLLLAPSLGPVDVFHPADFTVPVPADVTPRTIPTSTKAAHRDSRQTSGVALLCGHALSARESACYASFVCSPLAAPQGPQRGYPFPARMRRPPAVVRAIAFIDGQNLFAAARDAFGVKAPSFDVVAFSRVVARLPSGSGPRGRHLRRRAR
jgi:hypothetical protein